MTARDQIHLTDRRLGERHRSVPITPEPMPRLGELLLAARERKGVDLYRAERDTKIRAKYLGALERSEFRELPGSVYTKGFLRNYALYLGLDPDAVMRRWKDELGTTKPIGPTIVSPPRPLETPRTGITFTPGLIVAAILTLGVLAFGAYLTMQLMRFSQPPKVAVGQPAAAVSEINAEEVTLTGTADPGVTVTILAPGPQTFRVTADETGKWSQLVPLNKGQNDFTISAIDPSTSKESGPVSRVITVPIPVGPEAPTLTVSSPNASAAFTNGAIPITGTTSGNQVAVSAELVGPAEGGGPPAGRQPQPKEIEVGRNGAFSGSYQLAPGEWTLTISSTNAQNKTTTERRTVSVAFTGVNLVVEVRGDPAWLKVWVDGKVVEGYAAGRIVQPGNSVDFSADGRIEVRTGSSGSTHFILNGERLGALGPAGIPETWLFSPPDEPRQTDRND